MKRREFMTLLGGVAGWPLAARAQQGERMKRLGILMAYPDGDQEGQAFLAAFREEFEKLGWMEGCCHTGVIPSIVIDARRLTPIASFGARSRASFPFRLPSNTNWWSI